MPGKTSAATAAGRITSLFSTLILVGQSRKPRLMPEDFSLRARELRRHRITGAVLTMGPVGPDR